MNAGISEEVGQTARGVVEAMKSNPALLAMSLANLLLIGFLFYIQWGNFRAWEDTNKYRIDVGKSILGYVSDTSRLLAACQIPPSQFPEPPKPP